MAAGNALVTGASHGIGKAIAIAFARKGYNVGINYNRNEEGALDTKRTAEQAGVRAEVFRADVGRCEDIRAMFDRYREVFGPLAVMVNNAGVTRFHDLLETTEEQWDEVTRVDWKGTYFCTQQAARNMVAYGTRGVIVNIASNHAFGCWPMANVYAPTKSAVVTFTKNAALDLAGYGIRVLAIAPGYTQVHPEWDMSDVGGRIPMGRVARPEEIAGIAVFLASDPCAYMTGTCVTVDGGALLPVVPDNTFTD